MVGLDLGERQRDLLQQFYASRLKIFMGTVPYLPSHQLTFGIAMVSIVSGSVMAVECRRMRVVEWGAERGRAASAVLMGSLPLSKLMRC